MGALITVEGADYVGKSSVAVPALKQYFQQKGKEVLVSREPGGTPEGEKLRLKIFKRLEEGATTEELTLLFNQARQIHLNEVVVPFLGKNKENSNRVVILDRYLDSTRVYQGLIGGVPMSKIYELEKNYVNGYLPDITFILYFPEENFTDTFLSRKQSATAEKNPQRHTDEWDKENIEKHFHRQQMYLKLPEIASERGEQRQFILIDASVNKEQLVQKIQSECAALSLG